MLPTVDQYIHKQSARARTTPCGPAPFFTNMDDYNCWGDSDDEDQPASIEASARAEAALQQAKLIEDASWVRDGWAAAPGTKRPRIPVVENTMPSAKCADVGECSAALTTNASLQAPTPPPPKLPIGIKFFADDDPIGWVNDGWAAPPGQKRESRPIISSNKQSRRKKRDTAAPASVEAFAVGTRVEARWQASLPGIGSLLKKTHWHPGTVDGLEDDGTYRISYDDGDYEKGVKRRFVRRPRVTKVATDVQSTSLSAAAGEEIDDVDAWAIHASSNWCI